MFNKKMKQRICAVLLTAVMAFTTAGIPVMAEEIASDTAADEEFKDEAPQIPGLTYESEMELKYAQCFHVFYYNDGYALIDIKDDGQFLVVPEGKEAPADMDKSITVIQKPVSRIYLAATSAMALFNAIDGLDSIRLSGTQASGWYVDEAAQAMEDGKILFAGKYDEPDYELLINEDCDLAIESTMILHSPKVAEMIKELGIPVMIDHSSYETHPLGRTEWVKLYSVLLGKEKEAAAFFDDQAKVIEDLSGFTNTEKTVAYFYINTDGSAVVRTSDDYIPKMIEIAGGRYIFPDLKNTEGTGSSVRLTMEEFYNQAVNADYLIYNASIDSPITSIDDLLAKSDLFADFKAVKDGNVWCTGKQLYQATDIVGELIKDVHLMLTDGDEKDMTFLTRVS
ncbi:ABC transporter substrate-binding protein [Blautia glucerasea]|uniref:ABC transporter substrate-binding protein n=1 Tax=Blautia glucerasea TaxID=536633 RepID=UPI002ED3BEF6